MIGHGILKAEVVGRTGLLANSEAAAATSPTVEDPAAVLAVLLASLAVIFQLAQHPATARLFRVVPALVFCYFVPTTLTTFGVIPAESPLYEWVKKFVLPAALLLLILALDLPAIIRLGPKAVIMLLAGTAGIVVGAPIALLLFSHWLPDDIWKGMTALSGSWIGGGANFIALGKIAECSDEMLAIMVIPDVFCANIWMGTLLYLSGRQKEIDRWTGANAEAIRDLERRMVDFQARTNRIPSLSDLMSILALGFGLAYVSYVVGKWLPEIGTAVSAMTWKFILVTTIGIGLSFTRARNLEGAGASKVGSVLIYLLVACIGASADFREILEHPALFGAGMVWLLCHIAILLFVGWLIKAPIFFVAVGSQANIGGAASAPVVAAAFHPSLAPVGALLAVLGYVLGTYAGLICMALLKLAAGAA